MAVVQKKQEKYGTGGILKKKIAHYERRGKGPPVIWEGNKSLFICTQRDIDVDPTLIDLRFKIPTYCIFLSPFKIRISRDIGRNDDASKRPECNSEAKGFRRKRKPTLSLS